MRYALYVFVFMFFFTCTNNYKTKFSKELWKEDTVSYDIRYPMAKYLIDSDTLFEWSKEETIENLGPTLGVRKDGEIEHLSYKFHQKTEDGRRVYAKYFDLYFKDSLLIRYDVIEWDTLTMYKRIYFKERPQE